MGICVCLCMWMFLCFCSSVCAFTIFLLKFCCFFFFFSISLIPWHMACGVLVPWPEVGTEPLGLECQVQDARLQENSRPQGVLTRENSHEDLHPNPRPGSTQIPATPRAWQFTKTTSKIETKTQSSAIRLPRYPNTHHLTQHLPSKRKNSPPPTRTREKSLPTQSLQESFDQPHPPGAETKRKNYDPIA